MRVLQRKDYEDLAKEAVARMVNEAVPLSDTLVKISEDMGLNPDQIKALVQVANTLAHLDLFDKKQDGDKLVDFTPAEPDDVVKQVVTSDDESPCEAPGGLNDLEGELPDMTSQEETPEAPLADVGELAQPDVSPGKRQIMIIKIRKLAEEMDQRKITAALGYEEELDKLASEFARLYGPDYEAFEKDAIDVHGGDAVSILSDLRMRLRLPEIKLAIFEKRARLVDTATAEMQSFGKLAQYVEDAKAYAAGQELLRLKIESL